MKNCTIILSHPQIGENIGAVARVMSNFGVTDLRIVNPRDGWPNENAQKMAANGGFVLDKAKIFNDLESAISDINVLYGTASLGRDIVKRIVSPKDVMAKEVIASDAKVGILFGRERTGLTNEELSLCDAMIKIPTSDLNHSLNIAQAVAIICYECFCLVTVEPTENISVKLPEKAQVLYMFEYIENALVEADFFKSPKMQPTMMQNFRNMLTKMDLSAQVLPPGSLDEG